MKKVLSLVLAAVLAFGMATVGFAAEVEGGSDIIVNVVGTSNVKAPGTIDATTEEGGASDLGDNVDPGSKYQVAAYVGAENVANGRFAPLTTSDLSRLKITLKVKTTKGSELLKKYEFKNVTLKDVADKNNVKYDQKLVVTQIEFVDPYVSTKEKEFDFTFYRAEKGSKIAGTDINITGFLENDIIEVDEDDTVNLSEGQVAHALSYTKDIEIDTGNGLYVTTKMFEDKKYYAKSVQEVTADDDALVAKYPEIDTIYSLHTVNLTSASNAVTFDIDDKYFVYNDAGKYIGTTTDKLPMAKKYYLTTKKIDMESAVESTEETPAVDAPVDVDIQSPGTGGDDVPANATDNPGTGANGFVNVAVVAGLVALAAAGAVSMKK